jgi:hypothetical protein
MKPREVFFSHASPDRKTADKIAATLRAAGIKVWYSKTHLKGAQQWHAEIGVALRRCDWFLLLLTPAAVKSRWVERELIYALRHDRYHDHIAPLLCKTCDHEQLSWTLGGIQMIDLRDNLASGLKNLLELWHAAPKKWHSK